MKRILISAALLCLATPCAHPAGVTSSNDELAGKIVAREHQVALKLDEFHPLVETHIQVLRAHQGEVMPWYDRYFLSVAQFQGGLRALRFKPRNAEIWRYVSEYADSLTPLTLEYNPGGFIAMAYPDPNTFDLLHYHFEYSGTEVLGEWRCLVFDVHPSAKHKKGLFEGKIWVEDRDLTIVRFKGVYEGSTMSSKYFDFDSWRVNAKPDLWLPAAIYSEEDALPCCGFWKLNWTKIRFRAETKFWGYGLHLLDRANDSSEVASQPSPSSRLVPSAFRFEQQDEQTGRSEQQSENELVRELERVGLLSPSGEVEDGLRRIVANIAATNHLSFSQEVQCRVLLTSNLESAALGHTIVISRGLLEVLPNETVLAAVLAHELAHVRITDSQNAHLSERDRPISDPRDVTRQLRREHSAKEEEQTSSLAQQWMQNIPHTNAPDSIAEFAAELKARSPQMENLLKPIIGESICQTLAVEQNRPRTVGRTEWWLPGALPIARKINIDPWSDSLALSGIDDRQRDSVALEIVPGAFSELQRGQLTNP
jgi:hypothetical protein